MSLVGWVATHTGLPSLYATGSGRLTARKGAGSRLITNVTGAALVSDAGAAPGVDTVYEFGGDTVALRRAGVADGAVEESRLDAVTTADGTLVADVGILWGDPRDYETGAEVFTSALGRQIPRYRLGVPPETGTLEAVTFGAATQTLRAMVAAHQPLWVLHDATTCSREDCDVEGSRLIVPTRMSEHMSARRTRAQRNWEIFYTRVPDDLVGARVERTDGVPVVTWGQWEAWGETNRPSGWQNWSEVQVAQRVAGMPAV